MPTRTHYLFVASILLSLIAACGEEVLPDEGDPATSAEALQDPTLVAESSIFEGAPDANTLPEEGKFDTVYPEQLDLVSLQSPVRSQGSRGTCSIFSTTGLMEHLYLVEGSIPTPDFSEHFLQWTVKSELRAFRDTEGSSARQNLDAIHRFGIVTEAVQPYATTRWGTSQDERCEGDDRPTLCWTNGDPSDEVLSAPRYMLPPGRYMNNSPRSIKAYITENNTGVIAGMRFYYQSWNHRKAPIPTNSDYWAQGYVLYPNETDREHGDEKKAGHSILIVGWDDNLSVPVMDAEGNQVLDEEGNPEMETGFWLIKNSWGTSGFGRQNAHGAGYGWLSMRYVDERATVYSALPPELELTEICDDGYDNDFNDDTDCDDTACAQNLACRDDVVTFNSETVVAIPDNDSAGASSTLEITQTGTVSFARLHLDISHTYRGDLRVTLIAPGGERALVHDRAGRGADDLKGDFELPTLEGARVQGVWTLEVIDSANSDDGQINSWGLSLAVNGEVDSEVCDDSIDNDLDGQIDCADDDCAESSLCMGSRTLTLENTSAVEIPDNNPTGISSTIDVGDSGSITDITVDLDITHTFRGDLVVTLTSPDGTAVTLHERLGGSDDNLIRSYSPDEMLGTSAGGVWTLHIADRGNADRGVLNSWGLQLRIE